MYKNHSKLKEYVAKVLQKKIKSEQKKLIW